MLSFEDINFDREDDADTRVSITFICNATDHDRNMFEYRLDHSQSGYKPHWKDSQRDADAYSGPRRLIIWLPQASLFSCNAVW